MSAENRKKVVVLCSGGMDSVAALYDATLSYEVTAAISFHYGAKHNAREIPFADAKARARELFNAELAAVK